MRSRRDPRHPLVALGIAACVILPACDRTGQGDDGSATAADESRPLATTDPELTAVCDSLQNLLAGSLPGTLTATHGRFAGATRAEPRFGCTFAAADTVDADISHRPLDIVWTALDQRGWEHDPAFAAEGPEGRMAGLRRGSILCVLQHFWNVGSDDERAAEWSAPMWYQARAECFRDPPRQPAP